MRGRRQHSYWDFHDGPGRGREQGAAGTSVLWRCARPLAGPASVLFDVVCIFRDRTNNDRDLPLSHAHADSARGGVWVHGLSTRWWWW